MRILQLHAAYRRQAGEERVVANEAAVLRAGGHHVEQLIVPNPTSAVASVVGLARSLHNSSARRAVTAMIERTSPDVVHVHNTWFALTSATLLAAQRADVPLVCTVHNYRVGCLSADLYRRDRICTACVGRLPLRGVVHRCYRDSAFISAVAATEVVVSRARRVSSWCDAYVAPSTFMADRLIDMGLPAERMRVKPHFSPDLGERPAPPSQSTDVLFIGRLAAGKGLKALLRAWERLIGGDHPRSPRMRLVVIGDGPLYGELRESAPRGVDFAGWLPADAVAERLRTARALVFPSAWFEPFGMVLLEAMSAGLPVVVTRAGAAVAITEAPATLVAPPDDDRSLARALAGLEDDVVDAVGAANRARYLARFSPAHGLADLEQLYASTIEAHSSRARSGLPT